MTFKKFQSLFETKYPDGWVHPHGRYGGCEKNMKVTLSFSPNGKSYSYYGAYEDILCRIGINVISKERLAEVEQRLETVKKWNGTEDFFGGIMDTTQEIKELEKRIADYKSNWIIA